MDLLMPSKKKTRLEQFAQAKRQTIGFKHTGACFFFSTRENATTRWDPIEDVACLYRSSRARNAPVHLCGVR